MIVRKGYRYRVRVVFEIPRDWLDHLIELSQSHYDGKCKDAGRPGPGAFLHGMKTRADYSGTPTITGMLTVPELDLTCKILELPPARQEIFEAFWDLLRDAIEEETQINRNSPTV